MPATYSRTSKRSLSRASKQKARSANGETDRYLSEISAGTVLSGIRKKLFLDRYSLKDENGNPIEQYPEQMWQRVAWALSRFEANAQLKAEWEKRFYSAMEGFKFCPAGRFLASAGTGFKTTTLNCLVIPSPEDTRSGIINTLQQVTEISARGGGLGFNLSTLRPRGSYLKAINGTSSGAVSWSNLYSVATHDIIQQGGTRRGALMMMLWDWHPDIEEFITVKKDKQKILGANLSVCISDSFMQALADGADWQLKFPDTNFSRYRTQWDGDIKAWEQKGYPVVVHKTLPASELWDLICTSAWESAEPGIVFMDRHNSMNNAWYFEKIVATNPCAEQGLPAWGVCNLSSINLAAFVKNETFDYQEFSETVKVGVRFLDNAADMKQHLYDEFEATQHNQRRIGLGTMGLADALIKMKIRYGSEQSLATIEKIYKTLRNTAYEYSVELSQEKGPFPKFKAKPFLNGGFAKTLPLSVRQKIAKHGIRNVLILTQAPTGKISLLAGASSGIEPVFSFSYTQKDRLGERIMYHSLYEEWIKQNGEEGLPDYFVVADDLTPEEHVKIQAAIQKYTDSSISKTVNAPEHHTIEDVKNLYTLAYSQGCKGISYMREGSREGTLIRNKKQAEESTPKQISQALWERPMKISGATYKLKTPVGTAFITINHDVEGIPMEVFINVGRAGSDVQAMAEALGRLISKSLKFNGALSSEDRVKVIIDQLGGIGGMRPVGIGVNRVASLPDAIAKALAMDINANGHSELITRKADICPSCGNATLVNEMACKTCHGCGYSEC
jgi:ribonucleoside-diphosphate reductase alpha chain